MDDASSEFRHADLVNFRELVARLGLDYKERCWPTLCTNCSGAGATLLMSPEAGRNQLA